MNPYKGSIRTWIDEYFREAPDGLDVTAHVLNQIGQADMQSDANTTNRTMDQAKQEMGRLVTAEILPEIFSGVETLGSVKVDEKRWPELAKWVATYTQHRVGRRKK